MERERERETVYVQYHIPENATFNDVLLKTRNIKSVLVGGLHLKKKKKIRRKLLKKQYDAITLCAQAQSTS